MEGLRVENDAEERDPEICGLEGDPYANIDRIDEMSHARKWADLADALARREITPEQYQKQMSELIIRSTTRRMAREMIRAIKITDKYFGDRVDG